MFNIREHVVYALRNAEIRSYPFPHFYVKNVFPDDFYWKMVKSLAGDSEYTPMGGSYPNRFFGPRDIPEGCEFMTDPHFMNEVMMIFYPWFKKRYGDEKIRVSADLRLIRDKRGYQIGPHTDAAWKLVSLLFYLPQTVSYSDSGTTIFVPKIPAFRCPGGPHYDFDGFNAAWTAPYAPNSCMGFWKTDNSFHGVFPVEKTFNRDVLLYNLYDEAKIPVKLEKDPTEEANHGDRQPDSRAEPVGP